MNCRIRFILLAFIATSLALQTLPQGKSAPQASEEERAALMMEERLGELRIGSSEADVQKLVPCKVKRGKEVLEAATGDFVQEWDFPECGVRLRMASEKKGGAKSVQSISVVAPSALRTKRGIGIGSSEEDVVKAYGRFREEEWSKKGETFVAGSIYGGLIFSFSGGKVSKIFLGAAAE